MEITQANHLTDTEQQQLFGWGEDIFGVQPWGLEWRRKDLRFVLYDEGKPVSHAGILKHTVSVNGAGVSVAGLGGVVTVPEARGKGLARQVVRQAMTFAKSEWTVDAGFLFCRPQMVSYYEALGWKIVESAVIIDQPNGKIPSPLPVMVLLFDRISWPAGLVELQSLPW
jgi:aminoglycoside 2'-N-acetyltransferase I